MTIKPHESKLKKNCITNCKSIYNLRYNLNNNLTHVYVPLSKKLCDVLAASCSSSWIYSIHPTNVSTVNFDIDIPRKEMGKKQFGNVSHGNCNLYFKKKKTNGIVLQQNKKKRSQTTNKIKKKEKYIK